MKRLVAVPLIALSVAALGGCATVGQPGDPGVAATWGSTVVTTAEVGDWTGASADLGLFVDPGAAVSLLLLQPSVEEYAAAHDLTVTDADIEADITAWFALQEAKDREITPEMIEVFRTTALLGASLEEAEFIDVLVEAMGGIEDKAVISPLYGDFSPELFAQRINQASQTVGTDGAGLGEIAYVSFVAVSGFDNGALAPWVVPPSVAAPAVG